MADFNYASPEERVKARKGVLEEYLNVAGPAQEQQAAREKLATKKQLMAQTAATGTQAPELAGLGTLGMLQGAQQQGAQQLAAQQAKQDELNLQGAQMQQEIAGAKTQQALTTTEAGMAKSSEKLARAVADRAFAEGMEAKQLLFHANTALADYSLSQLQKDFESGRVNRQELQALQNNLRERATLKKQAADEELKRAMEEFELALARGNAEREKARILAAIDSMKKAAEDAARASNIGGILSGTFGVAGTIVASAFN